MLQLSRCYHSMIDLKPLKYCMSEGMNTTVFFNWAVSFWRRDLIEKVTHFFLSFHIIEGIFLFIWLTNNWETEPDNSLYCKTFPDCLFLNRIPSFSYPPNGFVKQCHWFHIPSKVQIVGVFYSELWNFELFPSQEVVLVRWYSAGEIWSVYLNIFQLNHEGGSQHCPVTGQLSEKMMKGDDSIL